jgi:hypothetical protein
MCVSAVHEINILYRIAFVYSYKESGRKKASKGMKPASVL